MPAAYVVMIREKTHNPAKLEEYRKVVSSTFQNHPVKFLALGGRQEVLEGPMNEAVVILEFPSYESAQAWYHSTKYQAAREIRFQAGDYRGILTEGVEIK